MRRKNDFGEKWMVGRFRFVWGSQLTTHRLMLFLLCHCVMCYVKCVLFVMLWCYVKCVLLFCRMLFVVLLYKTSFFFFFLLFKSEYLKKYILFLLNGGFCFNNDCRCKINDLVVIQRFRLHNKCISVVIFMCFCCYKNGFECAEHESTFFHRQLKAQRRQWRENVFEKQNWKWTAAKAKASFNIDN